MHTSSKQFDQAQLLFEYLYFREAPAKADAVVGFGHFDTKIPERCVKLHEAQFANAIIFTGGIGAGTADLNQPEGQFFREVALGLNGQLAPKIIVEDKSTNTGENVRFTNALLSKHYPDLVFGTGIRSMILVANAFQQRRVWLTVRKLLPELKLLSCPPDTTLADEVALFKSKGEELLPQLYGEVERIQKYPANGWIEEDDIPGAVLDVMAEWKSSHS